jgi:hypothetical protein
MSFYGGKKRWSDMHDVVQPISQPAPVPKAAASNASASPNEWASMRKAQPADYLLPQSARWLVALPAEVSTHSLAMRYPRIVNLIAAQWDDRQGVSKLFDDLLIDRRGGRAGFPPSVRHDLLRLREYCYSRAP